MADNSRPKPKPKLTLDLSRSSFSDQPNPAVPPTSTATAGRYRRFAWDNLEGKKEAELRRVVADTFKDQENKFVKKQADNVRHGGSIPKGFEAGVLTNLFAGLGNPPEGEPQPADVALPYSSSRNGFTPNDGGAETKRAQLPSQRQKTTKALGKPPRSPLPGAKDKIPNSHSRRRIRTDLRVCTQSSDSPPFLKARRGNETPEWRCNRSGSSTPSSGSKPGKGLSSCRSRSRDGTPNSACFNFGGGACMTAQFRKERDDASVASNQKLSPMNIESTRSKAANP